MNNKKKVIISMVIVLLLIVVVSSATYAVYKWRSIYGLNVNISVTDNITVTFNGGTNITGRIKPVSDPSEGIVKQISIKSNLPTDDTFNLYLKINQLPNDMKDSSFRFGIVDDPELVDCLKTNCRADVIQGHIVLLGDFTPYSITENFYDETTGDLLLLENQTVPFKKKLDLYLYIWIDGTVDNDPSIGGNHIDFDLYATGSSDTLIELPSQ